MVNSELKNANKKPAPLQLITNINEAIKNAKRIHLFYVGFLIYCTLTILGTSDREIVLNETVRLPIANTEVSLNLFFLSGPLIAIIVLAYFHLHLYKLKSLHHYITNEYKKLEKGSLHPWVLNPVDKREKGIIGELQKIVSDFSFSWSLPMVLAFFALKYIKSHDPLFTYVISAMPTLGVSVVLGFLWHYESVGSQVEWHEIMQAMPRVALFLLPEIGVLWIGQIISGGMGYWARDLFTFSRYIAISFVVFLILFFIIIWRKKYAAAIVLAFQAFIFSLFLMTSVVPYANTGIGITVDLSFQELSTESDVEYENIYWVNLNGAHLEGANLASSFLKRADLRDAKLQRANLSNSNLQSANFAGADLRAANLQEADLTDAKNVTIEQLCITATLFRAALDSTLKQEIKQRCPEVFIRKF